MSLWLFDAKGVQWDATSPQLVEALQSSIVGGDLARYAVMNLGFVAAEANNCSVRIRVRPDSVAQPALAAALDWLFERAPDRVLVSRFEKTWCHTVVPAGGVVAHLQLTPRRLTRQTARRGDWPTLAVRRLERSRQIARQNRT
jgi:hypothetical protein